MVQSHLPPFRNLGNFVHPTFVCVFLYVSFYLVSMPGEVKDPIQGVNVEPVVDSQILERKIIPALAQVWAVWR